MAAAMTDPLQLIECLDLPLSWLPQAQNAARLFPLRVPQPYLDRIRRGDPHDPLLRQILPLGDELAAPIGFSPDPVGDLMSLRGPGLLQKYAGRVLIVSTGACAIHCRYCFRRHFPYADHSTSRQQWRDTFRVIADDTSLSEVIFSGGDPFSLSDDRLAAMVNDVAACPHIYRIRFHTRLPIVLPQRIDDACVSWLSKITKPLVIVVHANHPQELDESVTTAFQRLRDINCTLLNQSVLLRGVNDDAQVLQVLSEQLFQNGVLPYYLHTLDRVQGAAHFEVGHETMVELLTTLTARLPGYLVPKLVSEIPGEHSKVMVSL